MFHKLKQWIAYFVCKSQTEVNKLLDRENVHTVFPDTKKVNGEDTGEPSVKVLVESKKPERELSKEDLVPKRVKGVRTDVEQVKMPEAYADRKEYNPVRGGCEISPKGANFVGTLGDIYARRKYVTQSGKVVYLHDRWLGIINLLEKWGLAPEIEKEFVGLSNLHVLSDDVLNPRKGRVVEQPGGSGRTVGKVTSWESLEENKTNKFDFGVFTFFKKHLDNISGEVIEVGKVKEPKKLPGASWYQKYGRTTEYTKGEMVKYPSTSRVRYGNKTLTFSGLGVVDERSNHDTFSDNGDSGAAVLDQDNHLRGKLFAGNGDISLVFPMKQLFHKYKLSLVNLDWTKYNE